MGNVQMEAEQIRFKNASYSNVQTALTAALTGGGGLDSRVEALETTVGDEESGLVKDVDDLETSVSGLTTTVSQLEPNVYSTTETKIGKDGNDDRYRKVVHFSALGNATSVSESLGVENVVIKSISGVAYSSAYALPVPYVGGSTYAIECYYDYSDGKIYISTGTDRTGYAADITVEYTKTPAPAPENNNR